MMPNNANSGMGGPRAPMTMSQLGVHVQGSQVPPRSLVFPANVGGNQPPRPVSIQNQGVGYTFSNPSMPPRPGMMASQQNMALRTPANNTIANPAPSYRGSSQPIPGSMSRPLSSGNPAGGNGFNFAPRFPSNPQSASNQLPPPNYVNNQSIPMGNSAPNTNAYNLSNMSNSLGTSTNLYLSGSGMPPRPGYNNTMNMGSNNASSTNNTNRIVMQQSTLRPTNQVIYPSSTYNTPTPSTPQTTVQASQLRANPQDFSTPSHFNNRNYTTPLASSSSSASLSELTTEQKGYLLKRKDFLGKDEHADSHPNRTYYFKRPLGDIDEVIDTCSKKLQTDPNNAQVHYLRGSSYFKKGLLDQCIDDLSRVLQVEPQHVEALYTRGLAYFKTSKLESAIVDLTKVLEENPFHVNAAYSRAACYNKMGLLTQAIEDYNAALSKDSGNPLNPTSTNTSVINEYSNTYDDEYLDVESVASNHAVTPRSRSNSQSSTASSSNNGMSLHQYLQQQGSSNSPPRLNQSGLQTPKSVSSSDKIFSLYEESTGGSAPNSRRPSLTSTASATSRSTTPTPGTGEGSTITGGNGFTFKARGALKLQPPAGGSNGSTPLSTPLSSSSANQMNNFTPQPSPAAGGATIRSMSPMKQPHPGNMPPPAPLTRGNSLSSANTTGTTGTSMAQQQVTNPEADKLHTMAYEARRIGDFQTAIKHYTTALNIMPTHFKALFNRAYAYDKVGDRMKAIQDYSSAVKLDPTNPYIFYNRGIAYDHANDLARAHADFSQAIALQERISLANASSATPGTGTSLLDFYQNRAFCSKKMNSYQQAIQDYSKLLSLVEEWKDESPSSSTTTTNPSVLNMYKLKAYVNRSTCYEKLSQYHEAIEDLNASIECGYLHQQTNSSNNNNSSTSFSGPYSLLTCFQTRAHVYELMQQYHLAVRDYSMAITELTSGGSSNPPSSSYVTSYYTLVLSKSKLQSSQLQQYPKALDDINNLITFIAENKLQSVLNVEQLIAMYYQRGLVFKAMQQYDKALEDFLYNVDSFYGGVGNISFAHSPSEDISILMLYNHISYCYRKLSQYDDAIYIFSSMIELLQKSQPPSAKDQKELIKALTNRAFLFAKLQQYENAIDDYSKVLQYDPLNTHAYHNRGISYDKLGLIDQAIADFSKVAELDAQASSTTIQAADPAVKNNISNNDREETGSNNNANAKKALPRVNSEFGYEFVETSSNIASDKNLSLSKTDQANNNNNSKVNSLPPQKSSSSLDTPVVSTVPTVSTPSSKANNSSTEGAATTAQDVKISDWKKLGFASEYAYAKHLGLLDNKPKPLPSNVQNVISNLSPAPSNAVPPSTVSSTAPSTTHSTVLSAASSESSSTKPLSYSTTPSASSSFPVKPAAQSVKEETESAKPSSDANNAAPASSRPGGGIIRIPSFKDRPKVSFRSVSTNKMETEAPPPPPENGDTATSTVGVKKSPPRSLPPHPSMLKKAASNPDLGGAKVDEEQNEGTAEFVQKKESSISSALDEYPDKPFAPVEVVPESKPSSNKSLFRAPKAKVFFDLEGKEDKDEKEDKPNKITIETAGKVSAMAAKFGANRLSHAPVSAPSTTAPRVSPVTNHQSDEQHTAASSHTSHTSTNKSKAPVGVHAFLASLKETSDEQQPHNPLLGRFH